MDNTNATDTTMTAGTLALTVWPDTPVGEHQRYAYRITDTSTGQSLEGRDLFTGAGAPVAPDRAMRDLAGFLTAAGDARQYTLDHPGTAGENEGLFPAWVADAARENSDALTDLTDLTELDHHAPDAAAGPQRWISVVFLQGVEANEVLDLIERSGADAAIEHLAGYDYGDETVQAALENGYVYDDLPTGTVDEVATNGMYTLTYNHHLGYVSLLRDYDTPHDPVLVDIDAPAQVGPEQAPPAGQAARMSTEDWFAAPPHAPHGPGQGLSL